MNNGDRVEWNYAYKNPNPDTVKTSIVSKTGTFEKLIKHKIDWTGEQLALVYIDNNQMPTKIPVSQLKLAL